MAAMPGVLAAGPELGIPAAPGPAAGASVPGIEGRRVGVRIPSIRVATSRRGLVAPSLGLSLEGQQRLPSTTAFFGGLGAASGGPLTVGVTFGAGGPTPVTVQNVPVQHDEEFIQYLFQRGRVQFDEQCARIAVTGPMYARKTHRLTMQEGDPVLERICFDCGFD
jgi:hypothetical protein